jgi:hypothetical protein
VTVTVVDTTAPALSVDASPIAVAQLPSAPPQAVSWPADKASPPTVPPASQGSVGRAKWGLVTTNAYDPPRLPSRGPRPLAAPLRRPTVLGHRPGARHRHLQPGLSGDCGHGPLHGPLRHHGVPLSRSSLTPFGPPKRRPLC